MDYESLYSTATKALNSQIEINDQLQAELEKHRWIPVSERLPKKKEDYFVSDGETIWKHLWLTEFKCWRHDSLYHYETITHWKPIILP